MGPPQHVRRLPDVLRRSQLALPPILLQHRLDRVHPRLLSAGRRPDIRSVIRQGLVPRAAHLGQLSRHLRLHDAQPGARLLAGHPGAGLLHRDRGRTAVRSQLGSVAGLLFHQARPGNGPCRLRVKPRRGDISHRVLQADRHGRVRMGREDDRVHLLCDAAGAHLLHAHGRQAGQAAGGAGLGRVYRLAVCHFYALFPRGFHGVVCHVVLRELLQLGDGNCEPGDGLLPGAVAECDEHVWADDAELVV